MSRIRFQSKLNGRRILAGNWSRAVLITFLMLLMVGGFILLEQSVRQVLHVPQMLGKGLLAQPNTSTSSLVISIVFALALFFFITPLKNGQAEWYWNLMDQKDTSVGDVFGWYGSFSLYGKSILLQLHILWRMLLWGIPVYAAPGALLAVYLWVLGGANTLLASAVLALSMLLFFCASIVWALLSLRYYPAVYLLVEDSTRKTNACVRTAARYSKGYFWEIFKFQISFLLWWLLCYLIFPAFYVMPYYNASSAVFARHIIYTQRAKERKLTEEPQSGT